MSDSTHPLPVLCENCRATGFAGDEAFAAIPDILDFEPVPRRAHANGWTPEHQRAFIAALAVTGSPRQAARYVGRATYGAEQLRTAKGGRSFADAWDSALDLARDRELARLHTNLAELARKTEEANAAAAAAGRLVPPGEDDDGEDGDSYDDHIAEVRARLVEKLQRLRLPMLREEIIPFPDKRAAWILLNGPEEIEAVENGTWDSNTIYDAQAPSEGRDPSNSVRPEGVEGGGEPSVSPAPDDEAGPRVRRL